MFGSKKIICPYCYKQQDFKKLMKVCTGDGCEENTKGTKFSAKTLKCPKCNSNLRFACGEPDCGHAIEKEELECTEPLPIAIIGAKFSGKSNYIAVVIREMQVKGNRFGIGIRANASTSPRYTRDYENPLFRNQEPITTTRAATGKKGLDPLIFMLTTGLNKGRGKMSSFPLSFYDTAGENLQKSDSDTETHVGYIAHAQGIIILVDPWQIPSIRAKLGSAVPKDAVGPSPYEILDRTIRVIRSTAGLSPTEKIKIPIAISFSKMDSLESAGLISEGSCLLTDSEHYNLSKYSRIEHDNTSSEIESMLLMYAEEDAQRFINLANDNFETYAFFGFSSFGCGVNGNKLSQKVKPRRVLDPFLWLLSINKRIETTK